MKKLIYIFTVGFLIIAALWLLRHPIYGFFATTHPNAEMPAFELQSSDGSMIRSSELRGKILVLDFWTTWCAVCKKSFPEFQGIIAKFKNHPEVVFLAVNTGEGGDSFETALDFVKRHGYTFPFAYDPNSVLSKKMNVTNYPTVVVIDQTGKMRFRHIGYSSTFENYAALIIGKIEELLGILRGDS